MINKRYETVPVVKSDSSSTGMFLLTVEGDATSKKTNVFIE